MLFKYNNQTGFIKMFVIIVAIILILNFVDLKSFVNSPQVQKNLTYITGLIKPFWDKYLSKTANYVSTNVFIKSIWQSSLDNFEKMMKGESIDLKSIAPQVKAPLQN